jgi:Tol biopolymer transport system component
VRTGVPKELERITDKCLAKDPERRYQHADELLVDLRALKQTTETHADPSALVPATPPTTKRPAWYVVAAVMTIAVVAAIAFWLGRSGSEEEPRSDVQVSPLTTYPGLETSPTFSPDGSQVAFVWEGENEDNLDIYVKVIGSEAQLRLTQDPADDFGPAWSPDGRSIAFLRRLPEGKTGVFLTPALGGSERKVSEVNRRGLPWSPDGRWLVVAERSGPEEPSAIYLLSPTSGEKRKLTSPPSQSAGDVDGAISPNGRSLVFVREEGMQVGDLFLLNLSNDLVPEGEPKRLTSLHQLCTRPTWTVGGDAVVFTSGPPAGGRGLFKVSVLQPERPRRLPFGEQAEGLAIASRGNRLAFDQRSREINIWRLHLSEWDGAIPRVESLISSTTLDWNADYSPDGNKIVFQSSRSGASEIWVSNSDGSSPVQLTHTGPGMLTGTPRWSPDGRRIVFDSRTGGTGDIWSIDPDGGAAQQITTDPAADLLPNWSRDGRWIYFASNRGGQFDVWKMPAAGGEQVQVTRNGGYYSEEATDGRQIYYTKSGSPGLWQMPVEGGEEVHVLDSLLGFADFAVAEDGIYFLHARSEGAFVQFYSFETKEIRNVAAVGKP